MQKLSRCRWCWEIEYESLLQSYNWCRECMKENISYNRSKFTPRIYSNIINEIKSFPPIPIFTTKKIDEPIEDLKIDYGLLKQKLKEVTFPGEVIELNV